MGYRPLSNHVRRGEWFCRNCGSITEDEEERCWNCNADTDGNLPPAEDEQT